jgi:DNA mismatch endonuclease (patch repair protein)
MTKSEQMARVRSRNTRPEVALRKALWSRGKRYRLHARIPGSPDIAFIAARLAVFVDGCFWHGCPEHYTAPVTNAAFWEAKLERNLARDQRVDRQLAEAGWRVIRLWEHDVEGSLTSAVDRVLEALDPAGTGGVAGGRSNS